MPRCAWGSITRRRRVKGAPLLPGFYVRFTTADGRRTTVYGGRSLDEAEETRLRLQAEVQGLPYPERDTSQSRGPVVTENRGSPRPEAGPWVQPGVTDTTTPTGPTLREFLDSGYLAALQPPYGRLSEGAYAMSEGMLRDAASFFAGRPMLALKKADIDSYLRHRQTRGNSPATIRKAASTLSVAFKEAIEQEVLVTNPAGRLRFPKAKERPILAEGLPSVQEMELFVRTVHPAYRDLVEFLYETGLRLSEATGLTWKKEAVAPDFRSINILHSKTGSVRTVPLTERAQEILRHRRKNRAPVPMTGPHLIFPGMDKNNVLKRVRWASWKALRRHFRTYDLRHVHASMMVLSGVAIPVVAARLGNSPRMVLSRYGKHQPENAGLQALQKLEEYRRAQRAAEKTG